MKKIILVSLFCWPLYFFSQVRAISLNQNWKFRKSGDKEWMSATVPGTVHTDLLANNKIPNPFLPEGEKQLQWIENCDWEYETDILCSSNMYGRQNMELQFEGLDTYAKIYLNDSLILVTDNMFRKWTVDVKKCLKFPKSKLRIVFESAVNKEKELAKKLPYTLPEGTRVFTRKAQYQYGWDFAPRFVTCGIWKNVKLLLSNEAKLGSIQIVQNDINDNLASLSFNCEVNCKTKGSYHILISPMEKENKGINSVFNSPMNPGINSYVLDYNLKNPKLWWCNGKGNPDIYHFKIELLNGKEVIDVKYENIGIRKIELVQEKDNTG